MVRIIIALAIIITMAMPCYASTGGPAAGLPTTANGIEEVTLPTTATPPDYGIGMPKSESLLGHLVISGFEVTFPINWDISTKSKDGGLFKMVTASSPNKDREVSFIMISLSKWIAVTEKGVYMIAIDQPTKLIYGHGVTVDSSSTKTELEIIQMAHFNSLN